MSIAENLARVREQIEIAAIRAGRRPQEITLVAVSKTCPAESVVTAYRAGVADMGENRVQEANDKIPAVTQVIGQGQVRWHMVGHLQRRKARDAVSLFDFVQSIDTFRLAETMDRAAQELGKQVPVLLQVNVGGDPNKSGFSLDARDLFLRDVENIARLENLRVRGLMTIGPLVPTPDQARPVFRDLRKLRDDLVARFPQLDWRELSMGMTDDYPVAIEEGATIVRIGRAIFGQRI